MTITWYKHNERTDRRTITLGKTTLYITRAAYTKLGTPKYIFVGVDDGNIVIRPQSHAGKGALKCSVTRGGSVVVGSKTVSAFLHDAGASANKYVFDKVENLSTPGTINDDAAIYRFAPLK